MGVTWTAGPLIRTMRAFRGIPMELPIAKGQRYICDAEPDLGLGLVTELSQRTLTIWFPVADLVREYAQANAPLSRVRHDKGDHVQDEKGQDFTVLATEERNGLLHYEVQDKDGNTSHLPEARLSPRLSLSQPLKRLLAAQCESMGWQQLRRSALEVLGNIESSSLLGLCSGRTDLLPHQLYIAHEVAQRPAPRVLLCDEVGLGKTIEACLIMQQQLFSGLASRVLIMVPDSLLHQWLVELLRRFNLRFTILDGERCVAITEVNEQNPFESDQLILCSRDFLLSSERWQAQALSAPWDLLIIDEAHHLLATQHEQQHDTPLFQMVARFAAVAPGLLLLTATPDQEGLSSHFALLQLLDSNRFHDFANFVKEQSRFQELAGLLDPLLQFSTLDPRERSILLQHLQAFASDPELQQLLATLANVTNPTDLRLLQDQLLQALLDRHGTGRIVFRNTRKQVSGFPERLLFAASLPCPALYAAQHDSLYPELAHVKSGDWLKTDPRVEFVLQLLHKNKQSKFLLICHERRTAEALEVFLRVQRGIRSAVFHEGLTLIERDRAAAWFAETEAGAQLLVCSEIGSEGRNFQFSSHLILFDLPANPDLLEQRIGRLDRIGQQHAVSIHVPYLADTAQAVLLQLFDKVFRIFEQPNPVAAHVCAELVPQLTQALAIPDDLAGLEALLQQAGSLNELEQQRHVRGRDRLLELNSCRPAKARALLAGITEQESFATPSSFLQDVFDSYGLDFDINSNGTWTVRPSDDMLLSHFPQVPDDGLTFTLSRKIALGRDDLPFVNWLHPLVLQSLDLILQDHQGKAFVGILKDKRLPAGTLVMEAFFHVTVSAPAVLQPKRWFPITTLRAVVDSQKRSLGGSLSADFIDNQSEELDKTKIRTLTGERRNTIDMLHRLALQVANKQLPGLVQDKTSRMQTSLDQEITRLLALQQVNPQVKQDEIDYLTKQKTLLTDAISKASLQVAALRLLMVA